MTEREKEQIKLIAAYRNGLAIAFFAVGGLTVGLGLINRPEPDWSTAIWVVLVSAVLSLTFHLWALATVKKLPS